MEFQIIPHQDAVKAVEAQDYVPPKALLPFTALELRVLFNATENVSIDPVINRVRKQMDDAYVQLSLYNGKVK